MAGQPVTIKYLSKKFSQAVVNAGYMKGQYVLRLIRHKGLTDEAKRNCYVPFTQDELGKIIAQIKDPLDLLMVKLGYYTGMRRGEIWDLRKCDVLKEDGAHYFNVTPTISAA